MSVDVQLSHPWRSPDGKIHDIGERLSLGPDEAYIVLKSGRGVPSTKQDAKEAGVPAATAASARK